MGIQGLTSYVDTLPFGEGQVWESFNLRDTKLVIDGRGLCYYIHACHGLNFKFGGQYDELQNKVKEFFSKLQLNNVVAYVVIDGIMDRDEKKFATFMKRKKEQIKRMKNLWMSRKPGYEVVLPRLTQLAIVQVLQEMQVPYAVADFEADCEIASLANELDAPVLGNDSDFYIFNIQHGYIPFKEYDFNGSNTTVKKFNFNAFAKHLGINPSMLPLLASLAGNDYMSDEMLRPFRDHIDSLVGSSKLGAGGCKKWKVSNISQFLSRHKSVLEAIDAVIDLFSNDRKASFKNALDLSIKEYQMKQSNLIGYFVSGGLSCDMRTYNGHPLPPWVVKLYRQGLIAIEVLNCLCNRKIFLRTQCEDTSLPSAQICAQDLRWHYYKLALNCEGASNMVAPVTELQSQTKTGIPSTTTDGKIDPETDFDHTFTRGFTSMTEAHIGNKSSDDTLAVSGTELVSQLSKTGIPSLIAVQTEPCTDSDYTHTSRPTLESQRETKCSILSPIADIHEQSKDSKPNMVTGQSESPEERETIHYDTTPSTSHTKQIQAFDLELEFAHKLSLNKNTVENDETGLLSNCNHTIKDTKFDKTDCTSQVTTEDIVVTELVRERSTLVRKKVNLTSKVLEIQIHEIPRMSEEAKNSHILGLLDSDRSFIHDLPLKHRFVAAAMRYWVIHSQIKPAHLAALLVYYVGEKGSLPTEKSSQISLEAVHGFSQWQNVLYWAERLNMLFSSTFPQLQVAKLYDGVRVCLVYERLRVLGIAFAESIVTNKNVYRHLYEVITKELPRDCQFNQSRSRERQRNKEDRRLEQEKKTKNKSSELLKGNRFELLCSSDSDEDLGSG